MNLGWYRKGRWSLTTPVSSIGGLLRNLAPMRALGFLTLGSLPSILRLAGDIRRQSEHLIFASTARVYQLDDRETFGE